MGHGARHRACLAGQLVGGVELDQTAGCGLLLQHSGPPIIGKDPRDKVLAQGQVVKATLLFHGQQGECVWLKPHRVRLQHDLTGEHAGAVALSHAVLIVDFDPKQARRGAVLLTRLDTTDKNCEA
jgi:hypothetical protein